MFSFRFINQLIIAEYILFFSDSIKLEFND